MGCLGRGKKNSGTLGGWGRTLDHSQKWLGQIAIGPRQYVSRICTVSLAPAGHTECGVAFSAGGRQPPLGMVGIFGDDRTTNTTGIPHECETFCPRKSPPAV
ncbi:alpha-N-acetylglucosaminidase-like protein [Anopheles sinensis]|uniref:Alpha-N-acetylglucosaminidase-like protein n=1 Tax=Anopheles sinensis TaxID=74873 RepID=A0A084W0S9_ANOSI|nr:alpha-N-acetylglucosaminidase-like protein [Anopheles sinensis]